MTENEAFYFLNLSTKISKYFVQLSYKKFISKILHINGCFVFCYIAFIKTELKDSLVSVLLSS